MDSCSNRIRQGLNPGRVQQPGVQAHASECSSFVPGLVANEPVADILGSVVVHVVSNLWV